MRQLAAISLASVVLAGCQAATPPAQVVMTRGEACQLRQEATEVWRNVRFKSLPGPYGGARIQAERAVQHWSQYCPDEIYAVYLRQR